MKKLLVAICAMMLSASSFAQYSSGGFTLDQENVYWGFRVGLSSARISVEHGDGLDARAGLTLGGVVGLRCSNSVPVFLESGLYYTERGGKKDDYKVRLSYLEVPVLIKYGIQPFKNQEGLKDLAFIPFFGPTFAIGIAGQTKDFDDNGKSYKHDSFGTDNDRFKRFDCGVKLGCGIEYNMVYLEAGYQWGVANISNDDNNDARNNNFFLNFGVNF